MKVLLLSPLPPPAGGIAKWTLNILEYPVAEWPGLQIISQDTALKYRNIMSNDLFSRIFLGFFETIRIFRELKANIVKHEPDVIHLTSTSSLALIKDFTILRYTLRKKIPIVIHWHFGQIPELSQKNSLEWRLLKYLVNRSKFSVVIDPVSYRVLTDRKYNNIVYIPNPVGLSLEKKINELQEFNDNHKPGEIIFVGHVIREKGVIELVEASVQIPHVNAINIVGPYNTSIRKELLKIASSKSRENLLKFHGTVSNEVVLELVRKSSMLVLPSYTEGFPVVVLEAMSMGCPVVATNTGALPEMLAVNSEKPCGICVPVRDIENLKEAVLTLLENPHKARTMGNNGKERILRYYTLKEVMRQYISVWNKAVND